MKHQVRFLFVFFIGLATGLIISAMMRQAEPKVPVQEMLADPLEPSKCIMSNFGALPYDSDVTMSVYQKDTSYRFHFTLNHTGELIYNGQYPENVLYAVMTLDGTFYHKLQEDMYYVKIPLTDGGPPAQYSFDIDSIDANFSEKSLANLTEFLEKKSEYLKVSLILYDPEKASFKATLLMLAQQDINQR